MIVTLVGTGYWGKHYARLLTELCELRYIVDTNTAVLSTFQTMYPKSICTNNLEEGLSPEVTAVFVVTPASTHFTLAKQCIEAKKHVFVEKPLTIDTAEAEELVRLAETHNVRLMTGFTFLFVPSVIKAREMDIGKHYYLTSRRTNMGPIRSDVSVVWDLVPHDIAMFLYWTRSKVVSVSAVGSTFLSQKYDAVNISLTFENGVLGSIFASWAEPRKVREFVIVGSEKTLVVDDVDVRAPFTIYHKGTSIVAPTQEFGSFKMVTKNGSLEIPDIPIAEPLKSKVAHFIECIQDPTKLCVSDGALGSQVTKILQAIDMSLERHGEPVRLS